MTVRVSLRMLMMHSKG